MFLDIDPKPFALWLRESLLAMYDRPVDHTLHLLLLGYEDWQAEERFWSGQYKSEKRMMADEWIDVGGEG